MVQYQSRPLRARELKRQTLNSRVSYQKSRPLRARELKLIVAIAEAVYDSRAPYGRVN